MSAENVKFSSITPLSSVSPVFLEGGYNDSNVGKFELQWQYPSIDNLKAISIYRYIGDYGECIDPYDVPSPTDVGVPPLNEKSKLRIVHRYEKINESQIRHIHYTLDNGGVNISNSEIRSGSLTGITSAIDNLSDYSDDTFNLDNGHELNVNKTNRQVLNEIYTTERPIVYSIATYLSDSIDNISYAIASHGNTDYMTCYSTKTQVQHDVLHFEMDIIWETELEREHTNTNTRSISRTSIDIDALHRIHPSYNQIDLHRRPEGRGGYAWVSCRGNSGAVFRFNLANGLQSGIGYNQDQSQRFNNTTTGATPPEKPDGYRANTWGHGIAVDINTGNCWSGASQGRVRKINNIAPSTDQATNNPLQTLNNNLIGERNPEYTRFTSVTQTSTSDWGSTEKVKTGFCVNSPTEGYVGGLGHCCQISRTTLETQTRNVGELNRSTGARPYQLGVYGAINNRYSRDKQWIAFCVKDSKSLDRAFWPTGNFVQGTSQNTKRTKFHGVRRTAEQANARCAENKPPYGNCFKCYPHQNDFVRFGSLSAWTESDPVTPILQEHKQFYDYHAHGGVLWVDVIGESIGNYKMFNTGFTSNWPTAVPGPQWEWDQLNREKTSNPYCIGMTPNGAVFTINGNPNTPFIHINESNNISTVDYINTNTYGEGITIDNPELHPNNDPGTFHYIYNKADGNIVQHIGDSQETTIANTESENINQTNIGNNRKSFHVKGLDVDDSNNVIGFGTKRVKIYRMRNDGDYPFGGTCRYPNVALEDMPFSSTNTREIEWFLTRNHYAMDTDTSAGFNNGTHTAKSAWLSLVEFNRKEAEHNSDGDVDSPPEPDSNRGWHPHGNNKTRKFGIRINPEYYNYEDSENDPKDNTEIISLIRDWARIYTSPLFNGDYKKNREGRRLHPNFDSADGSNWIADWVENGTPTPQIASTGEIKTTNDYKRMEVDIDHEYSYAYNQLTAHKSIGAEEWLYNYDLIHPKPTLPEVKLYSKGDNIVPFDEGSLSHCYPWPNYQDNSNIINTGDSLSTAISSYDNTETMFTLSAFPGTFIIRDWYLDADEYKRIILSTSNNNSLLDDITEYINVVNISYDYTIPSTGGRIYFEPLRMEGAVFYENPYQEQHDELPRKTPLSLYKDGSFIPTMFVSAQDVYNGYFAGSQTGWTWSNVKRDTYDIDCPIYTKSNHPELSSSNDVRIFERWPEPRFYLDIEDDAIARQVYFDTYNSAVSSLHDDPRYNKADEFKRLSGLQDAVRKEILVGVEPLSGYIEERSISRSFPISSWTYHIENPDADTDWVLDFPYDNSFENYQFNYTPKSLANFIYGTNTISSTAEALSTSTISDRVFSQCVNISEMEPFAFFDIISGETVDPNDPTNLDELIEIPAPNAQHDSESHYISGYAPYLKVAFKDQSFPHTFPISAYEWDFGDIYNEGPDDVFDPKSNYYTLTTDQITQGGITYDNRIPWETVHSGHTAEHTYIMPGKYNVTLTVKASSSGTSDTYTKYPFVQTGQEYKYLVDVVEVKPDCGIPVGGTGPDNLDTVSTIEGTSPLTAYFGISGFEAGSFLPCKIEWTIGQHIEIISRYPEKTETTSQGLGIIYPDGTDDISKAIIPIAIDTSTSTGGFISVDYKITTCNSNVEYNCTENKNYRTGLIVADEVQTINYNLFKNAIDEDGNIIYVFLDDDGDTIHTISLSGELKGL